MKKNTKPEGLQSGIALELQAYFLKENKKLKKDIIFEKNKLEDELETLQNSSYKLNNKPKWMPKFIFNWLLGMLVKSNRKLITPEQLDRLMKNIYLPIFINDTNEIYEYLNNTKDDIIKKR